MSNFPDAHKVYELAAVFRERVIEQGRSFLWPDQEIWTVDNANAAYQWYLQNLDPKTFHVGSIADKGREHSIATTMIAADVYALAILTPDYKLETVQTRLGRFFDRPDIPEPDAETVAKVMQAVQITVPATAFHYGGLWPQRVTALIGAFAAFRTDGVAAGATYQTLRQSLERHALLDRDFHHHGMMEMLCLIFPEQIPVTAGVTATRQIIDHFQSELGDLQGKPDNHGIRTVMDNDKLKRIYEEVSPGVPYTESAFFDSGVLAKWAPDGKYLGKFQNLSHNVQRSFGGSAEYSHIVDEKPEVYEIARLFEERVLKEGRSLLWPEQEVWTSELITLFLTSFRDNTKGGSWLEVFERQIESTDIRTSMLLADIYAFLMQFPSIGDYKASTKSKALDNILGLSQDVCDVATLEIVRKSFEVGVGSTGTAFSAALPHQLAYVATLVSVLIEQPGIDPQHAADTAVKESKTVWKFTKTTVPARNIVLHLLRPYDYERIASRSHKERIVESLASQLVDPSLDAEDDLDSQIRILRALLSGMYFQPGFDFYDREVVPFWDGDRLLSELVDSEETDAMGDSSEPVAPSSITALARATHLDEPYLREIEDLLKDKKQLIFEGPPGSGKTFVAEKFARYFTGQQIDSQERNEQIEIIQFHQSYSYEDFVEGIRPETNDEGQLVYDVKPGIFREFAEKAELNPDKNFVLIIDEINRGNVSRILGELMLLLEYRDQSATLQYSQDPLRIPSNLYIIGTMNSADRSLSQIDYALRRRFYFVRFMSVESGAAPVLEGWLKARNVAHEEPVALFVRLNERIRQHMHTDDLQVGHSYFMHEEIGEEHRLNQVWKYAVMPLLREYFYHQKDRDGLLLSFELDQLSVRPSDTVVEIETEATDVDDV